MIEQGSGFVEIGRHQCRERQNVVEQDGDGGRLEQTRTAGGNHDRINDEGDVPRAADCVRDHAGNGRRMKHPGLDGCGS